MKKNQEKLKIKLTKVFIFKNYVIINIEKLIRTLRCLYQPALNNKERQRKARGATKRVAKKIKSQKNKKKESQ